MSPEEIFVRGMWMTVLSEEDVTWVSRMSELPLKNEPLGDYGALIKRMLDCGVSEYEIARFAKIVSYETAFGIAYLLEDPAAGFQATSNPENVSWALYRTDEVTDQPIEPLTGLRELVLGMDPSGREMRPRSQTDDQPQT